MNIVLKTKEEGTTRILRTLRKLDSSVIITKRSVLTFVELNTDCNSLYGAWYGDTSEGRGINLFERNNYNHTIVIPDNLINTIYDL